MGRMKTPRFVDDIRQFPKIMTTSQVAAYLQLDARTVRKLAAEGEIPSRTVGGQYRYVREQIQDWMEKGALGDAV
jgi:excisionase family DNA binding protein